MNRPNLGQWKEPNIDRTDSHATFLFSLRNEGKWNKYCRLPSGRDAGLQRWRGPVKATEWPGNWQWAIYLSHMQTGLVPSILWVHYERYYAASAKSLAVKILSIQSSISLGRENVFYRTVPRLWNLMSI